MVLIRWKRNCEEKKMRKVKLMWRKYQVEDGSSKNGSLQIWRNYLSCRTDLWVEF